MRDFRELGVKVSFDDRCYGGCVVFFREGCRGRFRRLGGGGGGMRAVDAFVFGGLGTVLKCLRP